MKKLRVMRRGKTMWPITHKKKKNYRSRLTNDPYVNHLARTMTKKLMKTETRRIKWMKEEKF